MIISFFLWLLFFLFIYSVKKNKSFGLPGIHFLLINYISLIVFIKNDNVIQSSTYLFFFSLMGLGYLSTINLAFKNYQPPIISVNKNRIIQLINKLTFFNVFMLIVFLFNLNILFAFKNNEYLAMNDLEKLLIFPNTVFKIFYSTLAINGFFCVIGAGYLRAHSKASKLQIASLYFIAAISVIITLGANSRSSGFVPIGFVVSSLFFGNSLKRYFKIAFWIIATYIVFLTVIHGRRQKYQGISQIPRNIEFAIESIDKPSSDVTLSFFMSNAFAGVENFQEALSIHRQYPEQYKILSFSPFPNVIDNFDAVRNYEIRINKHVPFGANIEVYSFGMLYILLYFTLIFLGLRTLNKLVRNHNIVGYIISGPGYIFLLASQQYPLRQFFRFFLISWCLAILYEKIIIKHLKSRKRYAIN